MAGAQSLCRPMAVRVPGVAVITLVAAAGVLRSWPSSSAQPPFALPASPAPGLRGPGVSSPSGLAGAAAPAQARGAAAVAHLPTFALLALAGVGLYSQRSGKGQASRAGAHMVELKAASKEAEMALAEDDEDEEDDDEVDYEDVEDEFDEDYKDEEKLEAVCKAKYLQGSPKKFRRVLWQIRGRSYREALMLLEFLPWRACKPTLKALQSAAANAQNHMNMDKSRLYVSRCYALEGPKMKRMRPVSKGQAHMYVKKTTHLHIYVAEMDDDQLDDFE